MNRNSSSSLREDIEHKERSEALQRVLAEFSNREEVTFFWLNRQLSLLNNPVDRQVFFNYFFKDCLLKKEEKRKALEEGIVGFVMGLVFENQDNLLKMVQNDSLTGLLNRQGYKENIIKHMARHSRARADGCQEEALLVFIDVNRFKALNDTEGHEFGDSALKCVGESIMECTRKTDLRARYGGDEFVLFMDLIRLSENFTMEDFLESICTRVNSTLEKKLEKTGKKADIDLSFGAAIYEPVDLQPDDLLRRADEAMYFAKENIKKNNLFHHLWKEDTAYKKRIERKGRI